MCFYKYKPLFHAPLLTVQHLFAASTELFTFL